MIKSPECVAVGECGLDFNRNFSPPEVQLEVFEKQIEVACRVNKPLFLHERDAHEEDVERLTREKTELRLGHQGTGVFSAAEMTRVLIGL